MIAKTVPLRRPLQLATLLESAAEVFQGVAASLARRRRYALDRRLLTEMDDHALADLGLGRDQIAHLTGLPTASGNGR